MTNYSVRIHAIVTGNNEAEMQVPTPAEIAARVKDMNQIYAPANVQFEFDPGTDVETSNDPNLINDYPMTKEGNLIPPAVENIDLSPNTEKQNKYADTYQGKLVYYFRDLNEKWKNKKGEWITVANFSDIKHRMVRLTKNCEGFRMAHETGHYFALPHTHGPEPKTVSEAALMIQQYVLNNGLSPDKGLGVFDGDSLKVSDTPPDPSWELFQNYFGDGCAGDGVISVKVPFFIDGKQVDKTYQLAPDRGNVMSYFMGCFGANAHLSPQQQQIVRDILEGGERNHLIVPRVLYDAVWEQGATGQTWVVGWALKDFAAQFDVELKQGRHCVLMHAARLEDGQIRYNGVWEPGATGQSRAIGWAFKDFANRFTDELKNNKHLVHMQAYDLGGGQIRYDGIWDKGASGQTFVIGWALNDFNAYFQQEAAKGRHCVHMQAYNVGGQLLYDGVWGPGNTGQTAVFGWGLKDFGKAFDKELASKRHCVHMQAYDIGGGQVRYDAIWENGSTGQSRAIGWAFNDFATRFDQEMSKSKHLVLMQGYDIGGGRIRYDGVWADNNMQQTRALGVTFNELLKRQKAELSKGRHLVHLQSYVRSGKFI